MRFARHAQMKLDDILQSVSSSTLEGVRDTEVKGVSYDSRKVREGHIFVALPGHRHDGATFIEDALGRGAIAIVSERGGRMHKQVPHLKVPSARKALAQLACAFHGNPSSQLDVVGVTGTNGKTTTSYMIRDILRAAERAPGLIGTIGYECGDRHIPASRTTPEAPELQAMMGEMVRAQCQSVVMEVSSHALEQHRVTGTDFDVCVFTNLTRDHLDYHETEESYFAAKSKLFAVSSEDMKDKCAVINTDNPWGMKLLDTIPSEVSVLTFGTTPSADIRAEKVTSDLAGTTFQCNTPWGQARLELNLLGRFNVDNALAAIGAAGLLDVEMNTIVRSLENVVHVPGRMELIANDRGFLTIVDYAHTDDAMKNLLSAVQDMTAGRIILVFGCGGNRDREKRPMMGRIAAHLADFSILTSDNPRDEEPSAIISDIVRGFGGSNNYEIVVDREEAIARALSVAKEGDVVVVAGKGHESYQEIAGSVIPFDDRAVVRRCLEEE